MTTLAAPATTPTNDLAFQVKGWAKPVPASTGVAGEAGLQARVDVGPVSLQDRLVGYGSVSGDKVLARVEKSAAVTAGEVEVGGRVRTSVIAEKPGKLTVETRTSGSIDAVAVKLDGAVETRASVGVNGVRAGGNASGSITGGPVALDGKAAVNAGITRDGLDASTSASGTANVGSAAIGGSLAGTAAITSSGVKLGVDAAASAKLGGTSISIAASGSVKINGEFPFLHVDGSISVTADRSAPAPAPAH